MTLINAIRRCLALAAVLGVGACATAGPQAELSATDPHEGLNRNMPDFNLALDRNPLRPAAPGSDVVPRPRVTAMRGYALRHRHLP